MALAILDIDGTLVDTNYQHALAWFRAFAAHEIDVPLWRIHRHIGMGGDQLVAAVSDDATERELGDSIRDAERAHYKELIDEVRPLAGARELLLDLKRRGHGVVLSSSAHADEVEHYVDLLDARELADRWTSAEDVQASKPAPDLVESALAALADLNGARAGATMVGDSVWDIRAAERAGVATLAVLTGGYSERELLDAGAEGVYESAGELAAALDRTALA